MKNKVSVYFFLICILYLFRHRKIKSNLSLKNRYSAIISGMKDYSDKLQYMYC